MTTLVSPPVAEMEALQLGASALRPAEASEGEDSHDLNLMLEAIAADSKTAFARCMDRLNLVLDLEKKFLFKDPSSSSFRCRTALMIAAYFGSVEVVSMLLRAGADPLFPSPDDEITAVDCSKFSLKASPALAGLFSRFLQAEQRSKGASSSSARAEPKAGKAKTGSDLRGSGAVLLPQYTEDAFRMYQFKIVECKNSKPHDWSMCPFVHPGERARRRDPRRFNYASVSCPEFTATGSCARGDWCPYAHGIFEYWLHPSRYRVEMCKDGAACKRPVCFFAHSDAELRRPGTSLSGASSPHAVMPPGAEMPESLGMLPGQFNHMDASSDGHYGQGADSAQYLAAILGHPVLASSFHVPEGHQQQLQGFNIPVASLPVQQGHRGPTQAQQVHNVQQSAQHAQHRAGQGLFVGAEGPMWGDGAVLVSGMPLGLTGDQQAAMQMLMERQQHLPRGASPDSSSSMFM